MQPPPSLKGRALRLLGIREHSRRELERKLQRFESEPGALAKALDELQAKGFIDAGRVVESVLHRRAAKLGAARIRQELNDKGLDPALVRDTVAALQTSEFERAHAVWHKKFGDRLAADAGHAGQPDVAERARQIRFLASRGFTGDTIRRVISGAEDLLADDGASP